jgi:hypothetical protein
MTCDTRSSTFAARNRIRRTNMCLVSYMLAMPLVAAAQGSQLPVLTIGRPAEGERPTIDGRVDDGVWGHAQPFAAFVQQEPNEGEAATERTEIRFLLDRQNLYVAVICFDSDPQNILVSHSRRDADLGDTDSMRILLDTFNDGQNAFVCGTNPFGIEYDGQTSPFTPDELLGRSVVVKYTRLFDYWREPSRDGC